MNTTFEQYPVNQEIIECNGNYAVLWFQGNYYLGFRYKKDYLRHDQQSFDSLDAILKIYNLLLNN